MAKSKIFKSFGAFYHLGTYRDKLMSHWLDFYELNSLNNSIINYSKKYRMSLDEILVVFLMLVFGFRGLALNFSSYLRESPQFLLYTGAMFHIVRMSPFNIETLFFIWSTNYLARCAVTRLYEAQHFRWLEVCKVLQGQQDATEIGLTEYECTELRTRSSPLFRATKLSIRSITYLLFPTMTFIFSRGPQSWLEFSLVSMPWVGLYCYFSLNLTSMIYVGNAYVVSLSLLYRLQIQRFRSGIVGPGGTPRVIRPHQVGLRVSTLARTMAQIDEYNLFWRGSFTIQVIWRVFIVNFVAYLILFGDLAPLIITQYTVILINELGAFLFSLYHASRVFHQGRTVLKDIERSLATPGFVRTTGDRFKMVSFAESLGKGIGFQFWNRHVIEPRYFIFILQDCSQMFFMLINLSLSQQQ